MTVCATDPVLDERLASPGNPAVMVWPPTARVLTVMVATPDPFSGALPRELVPSLNVTEPVGVLVAGDVGLTVAVKVTLAPKVDVAALVLTTVVEPPGATANDSVFDELAE